MHAVRVTIVLLTPCFAYYPGPWCDRTPHMRYFSFYAIGGEVICGGAK